MTQKRCRAIRLRAVAGVARRGCYRAPMTYRDRKKIVIGRLQAKPLLVGQVLCALLLAALVARQAQGDGAGEVAVHILLGDPVMTVLIAAAAFGFTRFFRLWRQRDDYIFHDGERLHRGSDGSWPLAAIRDVIVTRSELGIASLRLVVDDDSETTRELVKLYMLDGSPEAVRGGVMFAVAGVRGIPLASSLH
jgi:hypothetical protein